MENEVRVSFLITENDFLDMSILRSYCTIPRTNKIVLLITGITAVLCGGLAFINIGGNIFQNICWVLLIFIGFYCISYYDVIEPLLMKSQARSFYRYNKEKLGSREFVFGGKYFEMKSDDHKLRIPAEYIFKAVEGKNTVIIFLDNDEYCFISKRILDEEKLETLRSFIGEEKYKRL